MARRRKYTPKKKQKKEIIHDMPLEAKMLTEMQRNFCEELLTDNRPKDAAIRAGYSKKSAAVTASQLMKNKRVLRYLHHLRSLRAKRLQIDQDAIVEEIARIAFHDKRTFYDNDNNPIPLKELTDAQQAAVKSVSFKVNPKWNGDNVKKHKTAERIVTKYDFYDKIVNLKALANHLGMSLDRPSPKQDDDSNQQKIDFESMIKNLEVKDLKTLSKIFDNINKQKKDGDDDNVISFKRKTS